MSLAMDRRLREEIRLKLASLEHSLEGRSPSAAFPIIAEANREIADAIEEWTKFTLEELVGGERDVRSIAETLAEIHRSLSGARRTRVRADARSIILDVEGCTRLHDCRLRSMPAKQLGCLPDMIVAAILQRVMDTPVRIEFAGDARRCTKRFTPAWLVELLSDLDPLGAEGLVVVYKDRVMFSHLPSEAEAEALSESLLLEEEHRESRQQLSEIERQGRRILLTRHGDIFVAVCVPAGTSGSKVQRRILNAIQRSIDALWA